MSQLALLRLLPLCGLLWFSAAAIVSADELPRVAPGYTVELVAGSEHVQHPMLGCFDERGRLYVCESAGSNRKAAELLADPLDSIKVLEDADGDGRYEKSWTFADKLVFPQGCLWYRGAVYTCSSPYLWKLEDTDGDGVCDKRTVLVKSFGFSGNAADIHGPFLSPDGRLYWCDGRHGHEIHEQTDGSVGGADDAAAVKPDPEPGLPNDEAGQLVTKGKAARIFSCRPDGSDLRVLCGGGMDNPVELDFWETGEVLGTVNLFFGKPRGDVLVHWVEGGVYPRYDMPQMIAEFPWTGGVLDPVTNYGHVAVSGLCRYRSQELVNLTPRGDSATFFVTQFNTHKLVRTTVERHGSTFRAVDTQDFLVSDNPDFHPTDVLEDADGSLLLIDTGGWFRIGCPTSQIAKPEIAGGIYRIRRAGAHPVADPRGLQIDWQAVAHHPELLLSLLGDARPAVRERARDSLALLLNGGEEQAMQFCQRTNELTDVAIRREFQHAAARAQRSIMTWHYIGADPDPTVRLAALLSRPGVDPANADAGLDHVIQVTAPRVASDLPEEARAAIETLGLRSPQEPDSAQSYRVVEKIMARLERPDVDRPLEHAAIVALTRIGERDQTAQYLRSAAPRVQKVALIALDQMAAGALQQAEVLPLLAVDDAALRESVLDVIRRRDGWAADALALFQTWLAADLTPDRAAVVQQFLASQARDSAVQSFVAAALERTPLAAGNREVLLAVMADAEVSAWPDAWTAPLETLLSAADANTRLSALRVIGRRRLTQCDASVTLLFRNDDQPAAVRIAALTAVGPRLTELTMADCDFVSQFLHSDGDLLLRLQLAAAYSAVPLSDVHVGTAADLTPKLGPTFVPALWPAYEQAATPTRQQHVIAMLSQLQELPAVSEQQMRTLLDRYGDEARTAAEPLLARFAARDAAAKERIDRFLPLTGGGDAGRGRYVFFGQTAACGKCHRVGSEGAQVGPDLTKIASIRQPRDLLESILLPSASFARDYHPYTAVTRDGQTVSGLISRETADAIVFRLTDLSEVRVPRAEIELLTESQTSIMPQGLEAKLSEGEFRDLLAYLQSLK